MAFTDESLAGVAWTCLVTLSNTLLSRTHVVSSECSDAGSDQFQIFSIKALLATAEQGKLAWIPPIWIINVLL